MSDVYQTLISSNDGWIYAPSTWDPSQNISIYATYGATLIYEVSVTCRLKPLTAIPEGFVAFGTELVLSGGIPLSPMSSKHTRFTGEGDNAAVAATAAFLNEADDYIEWTDTYLFSTEKGVAAGFAIRFAALHSTAPTTQIESVKAGLVAKQIVLDRLQEGPAPLNPGE